MNGPVKTFRVDDVSASIFARAHKGQTYHSVSLSRGYRDVSGHLKFTKTFDAEDLAKVQKIVQQCADWLHGQK